MQKYFNIAGPCNKEEHYMIEASTRLKGVEELIAEKQYFVIHAARQSGKTTYLKDLVRRLNESGKYYALYCSLESLQDYPDPREGIPEIVKKIKNVLRFSKIPSRMEFAKEADLSNVTDVLNLELTLFCSILDRPLIILFDEADCLSEGTLITFLRQLRNGYNDRSPEQPFVHSVALVGLRSLRDYIAKVRPDSKTTGVSSPFNIVAESLTLNNFTEEEIISLYQQHTDAEGQIFEEKAIDLVHEQTQGQPWLVNAVAREVIVKMLESDYTKPVTAELVHKAIQTIILRRDVHIDNLREKLREPRIRTVMEPVLTGDYIDVSTDDFLYAKDLGLIRQTPTRVEPANPIYAEVIVRMLNQNLQHDMEVNNAPYKMPRYMKNGRIDMDFLLSDFQQFWRENSKIWTKRFEYAEAAPHLILMAFLQRVVNGGGDIRREMAASTGRTDLCIVYEGIRYPIELKIRRDTMTLNEGLVQVSQYLDTLGCTEGWLALFEQRNISWSKKIFMKKEKYEGKTITVVGL